ncbi:CHAT domain-containing protein [Pantanalinema rosaneae CENA516]|uniref:CHAT domain-containing protein n=1 Tax=Pantanalinema rosaneae TaxID=1620701 RepID=UPI003D6FD132
MSKPTMLNILSLGTLMAFISTMPMMANSVSDRPPPALVRAQTLNQQGVHEWERGQAEAALATWQQSEAAYVAARDETGQLGSQLNQAQAWQTLGQYRRARTLLEQINTRWQTLPDSALKAQSLESLGVTLLRIGDLSASYKTLQSSLAISQALNLDVSRTLLALGNVARGKKDHQIADPATTESAIVFYQQAAAAASNPLIRLQARLNLFSLFVDGGQFLQATPLLPEIQSLLTELPPSRATVYAQVNLADSLIKMGWREPTLSTMSTPAAIAPLLANAVQQARSLHDSRAEAYALGQLGHLYELSQQWLEAERVTKQALQIADAMQAQDIAVSWQWQLGRILKQQGRTPAAIAAYQQAVATLAKLRGDLIAINPEAQFSFREQVEPIYRQLVQLLLEDSPTQADLQQARSVIEALQLAELNNFFREACLDAKPQQIDQVDTNAAIIYSIILPDRLAVILSLPQQPLRYHFTDLATLSQHHSSTTSVVNQVFDDLFATLNPFVTPQEPLRANQQLYDWLIRPIAADLTNSQVKTLVFVLDGVLQGVPLAALHDGQQYVIENYSIALTPGLQLLPPRSLPPDQLGALAGGLSEARQGFSALPGVAAEMQQIAKIVPTNILLNQSFTQTELANQLNSVTSPIVHLATHGQFSSQAENTFLLTWDGRIQVKDLDQLLENRDRQQRQPIELLILSACQTAVGDRRAALGLAGVAVRSGARSTIATLWSVQDHSTADLITQFYTALKQPGISRAEALRQAQLSLLRSPEYHHPYYWSPFVLVGNWQ